MILPRIDNKDYIYRNNKSVGRIRGRDKPRDKTMKSKEKSKGLKLPFLT